MKILLGFVLGAILSTSVGVAAKYSGDEMAVVIRMLVELRSTLRDHEDRIAALETKAK